jgi:hypothetical protein
MAYISEHVEVCEDKSAVRFSGGAWIEVEDLGAWISAFWDAVRNNAFKYANNYYLIEKHAFNAVS